MTEQQMMMALIKAIKDHTQALHRIATAMEKPKIHIDEYGDKINDRT